MSRSQGVGVAVAEHPAAPNQGVLIELAGLPMLPQRAQVASEVVGRGQRVGMIITQQQPVASQGILIELPGPFMLPQRTQVGGKVLS